MTIFFLFAFLPLFNIFTLSFSFYANARMFFDRCKNFGFRLIRLVIGIRNRTQRANTGIFQYISSSRQTLLYLMFGINLKLDLT
jgi:hypothetical protein